MNEDSPNIYKKWEFKQFLELIKGNDIVEAVLYAKLIGIDNRTLEKWYQQPEMKVALLGALRVIASEMRESGGKDWKMWRELLKLLGIKDENKLDITSDGEKLNVALVEFIGDDKDSDAS